MRTVATNATNPPIIRVTSTIEDPVWLKSDVELAIRSTPRRHLLDPAMARTTELLIYLIPTQSSRIEDQLTVWTTSPPRHDVLAPGPMARLTRHPRQHFVEMELRIADGVGRMTTETLPHFIT